MADSTKSLVMDILYTRRFITLLLKDFDEWDAFEHGIIDKDGNIIKKRVQRKTSQEKKAFTRFHSIVLTIKKTLDKFSSSSSLKIVTAFALLKEHYEDENMDFNIAKNEFTKYIQENIDPDFDYNMILEDLPTVNTAGVGVPELTQDTIIQGKNDINIARRKQPELIGLRKKKKKTKYLVKKKRS